jgi:hypothetical protein
MDLSTSIVDSLALNSALAVFHMQYIDLLDVLSSVEVWIYVQDFLFASFVS